MGLFELLVYNSTLSIITIISPRKLRYSPPLLLFCCKTEWSKAIASQGWMVYSGDILPCLVSDDAGFPVSRHRVFWGNLLIRGKGRMHGFWKEEDPQPGFWQRTPCHLQTTCSSLREAIPASSDGGCILLFPSYVQLKVPRDASERTQLGLSFSRPVTWIYRKTQSLWCRGTKGLRHHFPLLEVSGHDRLQFPSVTAMWHLTED